MDEWESTFTRSGKDGSEAVFNLFGSKYFNGEILNGGWKYHTDGVITGPFTALLDGSGNLDLTGEAAVAGNADWGWITYDEARIWLYPGTYIDIHMYLPSNSSANNFSIHFYLTRENPTSGSPEQDDVLDFELYTDTSTYYIRVRKNVDATWSDLTDVDGDGYDAVTNQQGTFRLRVHLDGTMSGYYHDGTGDVVEPTDQLEFFSHEDMNLNFSIAYPSFGILTREATSRTVSSDFIKVTYPRSITSKFERATGDMQDGDIIIYDTLGVSEGVGWNQVFHRNHEFTGEIVIQNGLLRIFVNEGAVYGLEIYQWTGAAWSEYVDGWGLVQDRDGITLSYPMFHKIKYYSRDRVDIEIRLHDDATDDEDNYIDFTLTLHRNQYYFTISIDAIYPSQRIYPYWLDSTKHRFGYAGNAETEGIGDDDLGVSGVNDTLSENYTMGFDDDGDAVIFFIAVNRNPENGASNGWLDANDGSGLASKYHTMNQQPKFMFGIVPFTYIATLFIEAESATTGGGATTDSDAGANGASGNSWVVLDANGELVAYDSINTNLPAGKYLAIVRCKDSNGTPVSDDLEMIVQRQDTWAYLNEERALVTFTPTNSGVSNNWNLFQLIFDVTDDMVGATQAYVYAKKVTASANEIHVDYFLIIPISNGQDWVQDLAQNLLRQRDQWYKSRKR
jgi:hypothetical protein